MHNFGVGSPRLPQTRLALLRGSGKVQGLFSQVLLLMGCRGSSLTPMTSDSVLPPTSGVDRGSISPFPCHHKVEARFPTLAFSRLLNCALVNWVNSAGLSRRGTRPAFPSAAAGKRISSLCQLLVVGEGGGHLSYTANTTHTNTILMYASLTHSGLAHVHHCL